MINFWEKYKKVYAAMLFFAFGMSLYAQLEASHWYFGEHAGLIFDNVSPTVTSGNLSTIEGCSSISNCSGQLLMYTDGLTIYDGLHEVMPNGTGLHGNPSSTQSGLIVPHPTDPHIYYVMTMDHNQGSYGLQYSVVDLRLNNGRGDVVPGQKNIQLIRNVKEKVTAIYNTEENFIWVVTVGGPPVGGLNIPVSTASSPVNTIYAVKIDSTGISPTVVATTFNNLSLDLLNGYMKISPQGDLLALAEYYTGKLYLANFDINTGRPSNMTRLSVPYEFAPYGVEFSPDNHYLYVQGTDDGGNVNHTSVSLLQYDLNLAGYPYTDLLPANASGYRAALQAAIDGKIYMAESYSYDEGLPYVSIIENPNGAGAAANVIRNAIALAPNTKSRQGLPQFIQSYFLNIAVLAAGNDSLPTTESFCEEQLLEIIIQTTKEIDSVLIDYGDGVTEILTPDPGDPRSVRGMHAYGDAGRYQITATVYFADGCTAELHKTLRINPLPQLQDVSPLTVCDINGDGRASFVLHEKDNEIIGQQPVGGAYNVYYFESEEDALERSNQITDPYINTIPYNQTVWYVLENAETGCSVIGTLELIVTPLPEIYDVPELKECDDDDDGFTVFNLYEALPAILNGRDSLRFPVEFYSSEDDALNRTNPIVNPARYTNIEPDRQTVYYDIIDTLSGCMNTGNFDLVVIPSPRIRIDPVIICPDDSVYVEAPPGYAAYEWSTGDTLPGIYVYEPGTYTLTVVTDQGCTGTTSFEAVLSEPAVIDTVIVRDFNGQNNSLEIVVSGNGDYEFSLDDNDYQDSPVFTGLPPGDYTVYVNDKNGCGKTSVIVHILDAPRYFSPNNDGYRDYWHIINIATRPGSKVKIYNRYGKFLRELDHLSQGWDGTYLNIPQPSDDYWYVLYLALPNKQIRIIKGHFSLIR